MSPLQQHNHKGRQLIDVVSIAFVINVIKWLLWTVENMYFDVVEPVFISTASSPARFDNPEASLCQDLLPGR